MTGRSAKSSKSIVWSGKTGAIPNRPRPERPDPQGVRLGPLAGRRGRTAVHRRRITIIRATGANGSTSAPAPSATWAATFSTRCSARAASRRPLTIVADGDGPTDDSWGLDCHVKYIFPATDYAVDKCDTALVSRQLATARRRAETDRQAKAPRPGLDLYRRKGVLYSPYVGGAPALLPEEKFEELQDPEARLRTITSSLSKRSAATTKTSAPFAYAGPLTEMVLLGCLATRFPQVPLQFDTATLKVTGHDKADLLGEHIARAGKWKGYSGTSNGQYPRIILCEVLTFPCKPRGEALRTPGIDAYNAR